MNENLKLYEDISKRTNGEIYIGVVGPVRTGKSTFIKNMMNLLVIPNIDNKYKKERALDELPQSGSGRAPRYSRAGSPSYQDSPTKHDTAGRPWCSSPWCP